MDGRAGHGQQQEAEQSAHGCLRQLRSALSKPQALSREPGSLRKAMLMRFQALMPITAWVRSSTSCSDSWPRTRSYSSSGTPCGGNWSALRSRPALRARAD